MIACLILSMPAPLRWFPFESIRTMFVTNFVNKRFTQRQDSSFVLTLYSPVALILATDHELLPGTDLVAVSLQRYANHRNTALRPIKIPGLEWWHQQMHFTGSERTDKPFVRRCETKVANTSHCCCCLKLRLPPKRYCPTLIEVHSGDCSN